MLPGLDANPLRREWLKQFIRAMGGGGSVSARSALSVFGKADIQNQTGKAYTAGGISTAFTLTTDESLAALAADEEWDVTFPVAAGTNPTLARDGQAPKNLKYRDTTGAKQAITSEQVPIGWRSKVVYDGTDYVVREIAKIGIITLGTAVAATSGTAIDFTGIPAWVRRVTVVFSGVSWSSGAPFLRLQLGSGSIAASGYVGAQTLINAASTASWQTDFSSGFDVASISGTADVIVGQIVFTTLGSNTWAMNSILARTGPGVQSLMQAAGSKVLSGVLDRLRITTSNGTDTFDAGSVNILYE